MYLDLFFIFILHKVIHQPVEGAASGVKIGLYRIQPAVKFKTLSSEKFYTKSMKACAIFMQMSNSCAACYHDSTDICYITQTGCYDDGVTDPVLGWHVLRKSLTTIYVDKLKTWHEAQTYCASIGGNLATVTTSKKHELILGYRDRGNSVWVGATDEDIEGTWVWHNPTQPVLLNYWGPSRPDNHGGIQHCVRYNIDVDFLWDDGDCSSLYHFVCDI